jgi:hypothetical protein
VPGYQVVTGKAGWGLRHRASGRWLLTSSDRYADIRPSANGWWAVTRTVDEDTLRSWSISNGRARLAREVTGSDFAPAHGELACANAFGAMWQDGARFRWIAAPPAK